MDPANNMGANVINQANNMGARLINRANNQWRVGSIITSTTGRINRTINIVTGFMSGRPVLGLVLFIIAVLICISVLVYMISLATEGFQSGNSNQRPRKISRKSGLSGKK